MRRSLPLIEAAPVAGVLDPGYNQSARAPVYWRTLEELADTPEFHELVEREFPAQAAAWTDPVTRRQFLTLMGASLALAGVSGCARETPENWAPPVHRPEQVIPGKPLYFATAMPLAGSAVGLLVESHAGRPTKVEGNPDHPASLGATDAFAQASVLTLYDPDRAQALTYLNRIRGWNEALADLQKAFQERLRPNKGRGFRILSEIITSPTLAAQRDALLQTFPEARWHQYEPAVTNSGHAGTRLAFGEPLDAIYHFDRAKVVVVLDADPFGSGPGHLRYASEFMERRRKLTRDEMNRLYAVESYPTGSGLRADHRLPLRAGQIEAFARALAARLGVTDKRQELPEPIERWVGAVAKDLQDNREKCVVVPGEHQPAAVHSLAHAINDRLGGVGRDRPVEFIQPVNASPADPVQSLGELVEAMDRGPDDKDRVQVLLILSGNPAFTAPADFRFAERMLKVPTRVRLGLYNDETSRLCHWHVPEAHFLEAWGDTRTFDGTMTVMQPLIAPLYGGRSAHEVLAAFSDQPNQPGHEIVRNHWRSYHQDRGIQESFDRFWRRCLHNGTVPDTRHAARDVRLQDAWRQEVLGRKPESLAEPAAASGGQLEVIFRPDPTIHDGRFANNGWLQELPKPITRLTWDNAALMSPRTARDLGIRNTLGTNGGSHGQTIADTVTLHYRDRTILDNASKPAEVPVLILPGHPDGSVTLHYGYGRAVAGRVGTGTGFNVYQLRTSAAPSFDRGLTVTPTGRRAVLACTQGHYLLQNEEAFQRGTVRVATLAEFEKNKYFATEDFEHFSGPLPVVGSVPQKTHESMPTVGRKPLDLYPEFPYLGYKWGMVVDLNACTGCGGCVVACQAENNIPVVGKTEVTRAREMHWLRIDQYHKGDPERPETIETIFQPLMCVHCENAPCEVVCPVEATSHSIDGLNEMTYNRCVGTRYCSNNCPYKVRRFNFLQYSDYATESLKSQRNPDVTVRTRGVMEKCTFCVQRIRNAEIRAKNENRYGQDPSRPDTALIHDGEVITACQAACPTRAIVFGDMNDLVSHQGQGSQVARQKKDPRQYGLLSDLNTRPRLTYLAAVRNPNPALQESGDRGRESGVRSQ
jgi:molybdopterin-containing oxidoreductase family iron-sulfur binding subunit